MRAPKPGRSAQGVIIVAVLGLIFLVVMIAVFTGRVSILQQTISASKIQDQNQRCLAATAAKVRGQAFLSDADYDGMADFCDPCPNNHYQHDKELDTDKDQDGLSEEGLSGIAVSPFSQAGDYEVNLCDKAVSMGAEPECQYGWDEVRQKCRCANDLYVKDRCATGQEQSKIKADYQEMLRQRALVKRLQALFPIDQVSRLDPEQQQELAKGLDVLDQAGAEKDLVKRHELYKDLEDKYWFKFRDQVSGLKQAVQAQAKNMIEQREVVSVDQVDPGVYAASLDDGTKILLTFGDSLYVRWQVSSDARVCADAGMICLMAYEWVDDALVAQIPAKLERFCQAKTCQERSGFWAGQTFTFSLPSP